MEKEEKNNEEYIIKKDDVITSTEDETLAPTDDIIPAPEVVTPAEQVLDEPVADINTDPAPVVEPVDEPISGDVPCECPTCGKTPCECPTCGKTPSDETPSDGGVPLDCTCCDDVTLPTVTVANIFGTLQDCITIAWRFHLKTRKHHIHVTLNDFYEKALDIVDDIIEQYQGIYGVVEDTFTNCVVGDGKSEDEYFTELKAFIENNRNILGSHTEIDSVIDDLLGLIDSTLYKLTSFTESAVKSFEEFVYEDYQEIKESCKYDRCGERSCDDPEDDDYDPNFDAEEE